MEKMFSKDRMLLFARSIWLQNRSKDWRLAIVIAAVMAFFGLVSPLYGSYDFLSLPVKVILVILAGTTFKMLGNPSRAISFLTIPASTAEKTAVIILYLQVYYLVGMCVVSFVGYYVGQLLHNLLLALPFVNEFFNGADSFTAHQFSVASVSFPEFGNTLMTLSVFISIFLFGSVYFRKNALLKTVLSICAFLFALFLIDVFVFGIATTGFGCTFSTSKAFPELTPWAQDVISYGLRTVVVLFFWFMTYLRLRETEA